jgi:hypothetical protein
MDWVRMTPNKEGLVARVVVRNRKVESFSLLPVTRDDQNTVRILDPASGEGSNLLQKVKALSKIGKSGTDNGN